MTRMGTDFKSNFDGVVWNSVPIREIRVIRG